MHRDLKPGNVMVTKPGVKLLDFGLAKMSEQKVAAPEDSEQPTRNKPLTDAGTILGTVQYMAPEQLEGKEVDVRSDLFALGVILFEMVTGRKAFEGQSQASLISAIMRTEPPPVSTLQSLSPPALDRIVKKCLAKDPEDRWQSAHDLKDDLSWIALSDARTSKASSRTSRGALYAMAAVTLAALALGATSLLRKDSGTSGAHSYHLSVDLPEDLRLLTRSNGMTLSPDGSTLVFNASRDGVTQVWRRELTTFEAHPVPGTLGARGAFPVAGRRMDRFLRRRCIAQGSYRTRRPSDHHPGICIVTRGQLGRRRLYLFWNRRAGRARTGFRGRR